MERTSIIHGDPDSCILLICPHGAKGDDDNTAELTEIIANDTGCSAVINRGFKRGPKYDYSKEQADCNNVNHCIEDVVREEFFEPIQEKASYLEKTMGICRILLIHGMRNHQLPDLDVVVGFGASQKFHNRQSCSDRAKNAILYLLSTGGFGTYQGRPDGTFSGTSSTNLNQYNWGYQTESVQLEFKKGLRETAMLQTTSQLLVGIVNKFNRFALNELGNMGNNQLLDPKGFAKNWESLANSLPKF